MLLNKVITNLSFQVALSKFFIELVVSVKTKKKLIVEKSTKSD